MKKELDYFTIEGAYGGYQEWFSDPMMKLSGCAAVTACDCCIYFDFYRGTNLYPYDRNSLTKKDYIQFGMVMKPYLKPRWSGIDRLEIYLDGFQKFLSDRGCNTIGMKSFAGSGTVSEARNVLMEQIDRGLPVPCLVLKHKNTNFKNYVWHWFLLTGYEVFEDQCMVKVVTYGSFHWLDLDELWNTGYRRKGGLILFEDKEGK